MRAADEAGKGLGGDDGPKPPRAGMIRPASVSITIRELSGRRHGIPAAAIDGGGNRPVRGGAPGHGMALRRVAAGFTASVSGIGPSCVVVNVRDGLPTVAAPR